MLPIRRYETARDIMKLLCNLRDRQVSRGAAVRLVPEVKSAPIAAIPKAAAVGSVFRISIQDRRRWMQLVRQNITEPEAAALLAISVRWSNGDVRAVR